MSSHGRYEKQHVTLISCCMKVGLALSRDSSPFCGGSIVSGNTVVTAAHCTEQFRARDIWIIVGDHDTTVDDGEERMKVCKKKEHPGYNE